MTTVHLTNSFLCLITACRLIPNHKFNNNTQITRSSKYREGYIIIASRSKSYTEDDRQSRDKKRLQTEEPYSIERLIVIYTNGEWKFIRLILDCKLTGEKNMAKIVTALGYGNALPLIKFQVDNFWNEELNVNFGSDSDHKPEQGSESLDHAQKLHRMHRPGGHITRSTQWFSILAAFGIPYLSS